MSTLKVDNLSSVDGNSTVLTGGNHRPGEIIEVISGACDGRTVTGISGSYTLENVTATQNLTTSYVDISGSSIIYTPPVGTNTVIYNFVYNDSRGGTTQVLYHMTMYIDSDEVTASRNTPYIQYQSGRRVFQYVIQCNASAEDISKGQLTSWTSAKTLKAQAREYSSSNQADLHNLYYWDGASSSQVIPPQLTITAIA